MKRLELFFENEEGKTVKYTLDDPIEPVDHEVIRAAMDVVVEEDIFYSIGGSITRIRRARVVDQTIEDIDLG
ncbi:MAG TPA: DUF2922 domain-containing protein [Bacillota bacterium]|nr:DUF2922 domain-containing protein [Bacillota bacterium]